MDQTFLEKRFSPRGKYELVINVFDNVLAEIIDISERGICFSAKENLAVGLEFECGIDFGSSSLDFHFCIVRVEYLEKDKKFLYGAKYIGLQKEKCKMLRAILIETRIKHILNNVRDPLIKERISTYFFNDISGYLDDLDELQKEIAYKNDYDQMLGRKLASINDRIILKGNSLEEIIEEKKVKKAIKESFRFFTGIFAYKSIIVKRSFEKPRGYPGDYMMLENVYNNQIYSEDIGKYYDRYLLDNPYAVAVRCRKDKLKEMLHEFVSDNEEKSQIKILNLACGSCREIAELIPAIKYKKPLTFTCVDWDEEALKFSRQSFQALPLNIKVELMNKDIIAMIKDRKEIENLGMQDLIYSMGLIDYLPDRILKRWIHFFYQLLPKNGKLLLTHKNREKTFPPLAPNWFCDWKFVPRSKEEVLNLLDGCGLTEFSLDMDVDDFMYIFYFTLTKK